MPVQDLKRVLDYNEPKAVLGSTYYKLGKNKEAANAWGPWDPEKFTVEDSAFGFITMENGATITLESSWALNTLDEDEAKCSLSGTIAGADMKDGLRINGENFGTLYENHINLNTGGVAFYDGKKESDSDLAASLWIECIQNNTDPVVKPEEAFTVTQILEALYELARTGCAVYLNNDLTSTMEKVSNLNYPSM